MPRDGVVGHPAERHQGGPGVWRDTAAAQPCHLHPPPDSVVLWGRQGYKFNVAEQGRCVTGDCGGSLYCNGASC
jgi:hypothetical protein